MDSSVAFLPNESILVARAVTHPSAFAAIYDHYFPRVYNYVRYRVGNAEAADDLTAQTFERTLRSLNRYSPERAPFETWLFAIARHAISDHLRAHRRRRWLSLDTLRDRLSPKPEPEEIVLHAETRDELLAALARLGDRERDMIALRFAAGLTHRRIAQLTGLSESHVGVILYRAVRRLRIDLAAQGVSD